MPIEIRMPALSPTMEVGTLARWMVKEGDAVVAGDMIAEIETDKATMEVETIDDGIVGKLFIGEGVEDVPVGALIAVLLEEGEDASIIDSINPDAPPANMAEVVTHPSADASLSTTSSAKPATPKASKGNGRVTASPVAKRMAAEMGIDLANIQGTGPRGRIIKRDLESAAPDAPVTSAAPVVAPGVAEPSIARAPSVPPAAIGDAPFVEERLSTMRKVIAARLTESKQTVPHYYLTQDIEIDKLMAQRSEANALLDDGRISVNDYIIKAVALALGQVPDANVQWGGDVLRRFSRADVAVAVAIPGGLITPIIRDAAAKSLRQISAEIKELAGRAKAGKLLPEEYQGGTFSISNLGMYGIREFSAVINPPQAGILAIGAGEPRPVVRDGAVMTRTIMTVTGSFDHRAVDGAVGAEFMGAVKRFLEDPILMLV